MSEQMNKELDFKYILNVNINSKNKIKIIH